MLNIFIGSLMVRELFIGNLNLNFDQKTLETNLGIYGEIENVDYF
jgi:hypothetical protein